MNQSSLILAPNLVRSIFLSTNCILAVQNSKYLLISYYNQIENILRLFVKINEYCILRRRDGVVGP